MSATVCISGHTKNIYQRITFTSSQTEGLKKVLHVQKVTKSKRYRARNILKKFRRLVTGGSATGDR